MPLLTILTSPENKLTHKFFFINLVMLAGFAFVYFIRLNNARLHDFNSSGWWNILAFIPLINLFFYLVLFVKSGNKNENRFGPPAASPSLAKKFAVILSLIIIWGLNGLIILGSIGSQLNK